jgi:hypothetical protein
MHLHILMLLQTSHPGCFAAQQIRPKLSRFHSSPECFLGTAFVMFRIISRTQSNSSLKSEILFFMTARKSELNQRGRAPGPANRAIVEAQRWSGGRPPPNFILSGRASGARPTSPLLKAASGSGRPEADDHGRKAQRYFARARHFVRPDSGGHRPRDRGQWVGIDASFGCRHKRPAEQHSRFHHPQIVPSGRNCLLEKRPGHTGAASI